MTLPDKASPPKNVASRHLFILSSCHQHSVEPRLISLLTKKIMHNFNVPHNTEDKQWWTKHGEKLEKIFIEEVAPDIGLDAKWNPKKETDPYAPDLLVDGIIADLKTQNTPFFTAGKYDKDPGRTVTFNLKDLERYQRLYPDLLIYFYVRWNQLEGYGKKVQFLHGVWKTDVKSIDNLIQLGKAPIHEYQRRANDQKGNARDSYLLSLDDLQLIKLIA